MLELVLYIVVPLVVLAVFWTVGSANERKHLKSLVERERMLQGVLLTTLKRPCGAVSAERTPQLVCGEAVIASDGFKSWLFGLQNLVGGESKTFGRLFDRARREATLRLKEAARELGYNAVCNIRYDGADIGGNTSASGKKANPMAVCLVSGTAYLKTE